MEKKYYCLESTLDIICENNRTIHLWINEQNIPTIEKEETFIKIARKIQEYVRTSSHPKTIIKFITENIDFLNAVQVIETISSIARDIKLGCVTYLVPFDDDLHKKVETIEKKLLKDKQKIK